MLTIFQDLEVVNNYVYLTARWTVFAVLIIFFLYVLGLIKVWGIEKELGKDNKNGHYIVWAAAILSYIDTKTTAIEIVP